MTGNDLVNLANANVGKGACSTNSLGGQDFFSSCTGNGGYPEYWCADFVRWVWANAGAQYTDELNAAAGSFYLYGQKHGTLHNNPQLGDAVVFDYNGNGYADHVAIVTQVNANGTIESLSGDWNGQSGTEAQFASTAHVVLNAPAYTSSVGASPGVIGMTISGYISPVGISPPYPFIANRSAVDINGDGHFDICARGVAGIGCEVSSQGGALTPAGGPAWSDGNGWANPAYYRTIQFADVNGDGKGDICARDSQGIVCELSNGNGFGTEIRGPAWSDANGWAFDQYYQTIQFADVNGDGKADVCARSGFGIVCNLSDGHGFPTPINGPAWSDANGWNQPQYYQTIRFIDVNGDGKADICGRAAAGIGCNLSDGNGFPTAIPGPAWSDANGWSKPEYMETIRWADINGDGKMDVCGRASDGIFCELSDGNGFPTEIKGPAWSDANGFAAAQYYTTIQTADINGDGKADLCARGGAGIGCVLSQGTSFGAGVSGPGWSSAGGWDDPQYNSTIAFADVNGDGKDDVCGRGYDGVFCALSNGTGFDGAQPGPAWSNPNGFGVEQYYATIHYAGVAHKKPTPPVPSGNNGGTDGGASSGGNTGNIGNTGGGGQQIGGCSVGHLGSASSMGWLALAVSLFAAGRRRSKRN